MLMTDPHVTGMP